MKKLTKLKKVIAAIMCLLLFITTGCENAQIKENKLSEWLTQADLSAEQTADELYKAALEEDTLVIYSVASRAFDAKESFEKDYPGLTIEVKDIRSNDVVSMLKSNYENDNFDCDVVICSDCDGSLKTELLDKGIVYSYVPFDIAEKLNEHEDELNFIGETVMLFYNKNKLDEQPIANIWELTDEKWAGKIVMSNPLSSFSTYGFCATLISYDEKLTEAYESFYGKTLDIPDGKTVGEVFWEMAAKNIVFTNSSDDVLEMISSSGDNSAELGIMISSKMRYMELGYSFEPIYKLEPFSAVYTPNNITIVGGSKNINSAKLFIRYILGETDGTGDGIKPFTTLGTWSVRNDMPDGNPVPLTEIDYVNINRQYIYDNRTAITTFWSELLKERLVQ